MPLESDDNLDDRDASGQAGVDLVRSFVDDGLNGHRLEVVGTLFSSAYRDHDPLRVPMSGAKLAKGSAGTTRDVQVVIGFLAQESVDIGFHLEDAFGVGDRVGYRLYGEGTMELAVGSELLHAVAMGEPGARASLSESGNLLGNRLHIEYRSVGIFRVAGGRLAERWGPIDVR